MACSSATLRFSSLIGLLAGGGLLALGIYNLSTGDKEFQDKHIEYLGSWTSYALICLGGLTAVISFIACCAANQSPTAATIFFVFMQLIFGTLLVTATYAYVELPHAEHIISRHCKPKHCDPEDVDHLAHVLKTHLKLVAYIGIGVAAFILINLIAVFKVALRIPADDEEEDYFLIENSPPRRRRGLESPIYVTQP